MAGVSVLIGAFIAIAWVLAVIFTTPIGQLVKKGFAVATKSAPVVGIMFVFGSIWSFLNIYISPRIQARTQNPSAKVSILIIIATLVFVLTSIFFQAGTLGYIRDRIKQGTANLNSFTSAGSKYYLRLFLVGLMVLLITALFIIIAAFALAFLKKPGLVVAVPVAIVALYVLLLMFFAPYMVVIDEKSPIESIKNSISTIGKETNFFFGIVLVLTFLLLLLAYLLPSFRNSKLGQKNFVAVIVLLGTLVVVGFVTGLITGALLGLLNTVAPGVASQIAYALLSSLLNAFLGIFVTASFTGLYLELSRKAAA